MKGLRVDHTVSPAEEGQRLDVLLVRLGAGSISRAEVRKAIESGAMRLNGNAVKRSHRVRPGDGIAGEIPPVACFTLEASACSVPIVYEDDDFLVVEKPAGLVVHPGAGRKTGTLVQALLSGSRALSGVGGAERPGIVHRLDKETSGLLLVAKNDQMHRLLQEAFSSRSVSKTYVALVWGLVEFEEGHIEASIGRDTRSRLKMAVSNRPGSRSALTRYRVKKRFKRMSLLELNLVTGRTHQIRVHLAHLGHPVVGDPLYGRDRRPAEWRGAPSVRPGTPDTAPSRMALHAARLEFQNPKNGKMMRFESPLPAEMAEMLRRAQEE